MAEKSYIQTLEAAVEQTAGEQAKVKYYRSVPVKEVFGGQLIWEGTVEIFALYGHPKATRCYAWGHAMRDTGKEVRIVTVLGIPPVDSARKAVQVSIVADAKQSH